MGLLVDLTNTTRFYDRNDIEKDGIKYVKLQCKGYEEYITDSQLLMGCPLIIIVLVDYEFKKYLMYLFILTNPFLAMENVPRRIRQTCSSGCVNVS